LPETARQRAARLVAEATAKPGDIVVRGEKAHRVLRPDYILGERVRTYCGLSAAYRAPVDGAQQAKHCAKCEADWKVASELAKLRGLSH
jgi:hypothetical protein